MPEQFSQVKAEKKMVTYWNKDDIKLTLIVKNCFYKIESKLEESKITKAQNAEDIKRFEVHIAKLQKVLKN